MDFTLTAADRQAAIVRDLQAMASNFYPWPGDAARYVIEGCWPDASREEWQFAADYVDAHPEVKDGPKRHIAQVREDYRLQADQLSTSAAKAAREKCFDDALDLLRQAFLLNPDSGPRYAGYAEHVEAWKAAAA